MIDLNFEAELWQPAVPLRGIIGPADYKPSALPLLFLGYLSLRYELRRKELERICDDPHTITKAFT